MKFFWIANTHPEQIPLRINNFISHVKRKWDSLVNPENLYSTGSLNSGLKFSFVLLINRWMEEVFMRDENNNQGVTGALIFFIAQQEQEKF